MSSTLHIALHDGFERDTVVITVNGEEVYRENDISTDYRVGVAGAVDVEMEDADAPLQIDVEVATKSLTGQLILFETKETWVSVKCLDGRVEMESQADGFRYM